MFSYKRIFGQSVSYNIETCFGDSSGNQSTDTVGELRLEGNYLITPQGKKIDLSSLSSKSEPSINNNNNYVGATITKNSDGSYTFNNGQGSSTNISFSNSSGNSETITKIIADNSQQSLSYINESE